MTAAVPDPRFRDQLAEAAAALVAHHVSPAIGWWRSADAQGETFDRVLLADRYKRAAEAVLELARAEVEARVQAAAKQRAAEERGRWITALGVLAARHNLRWFALELRDHAAALASPAPAPHAEEGQRSVTPQVKLGPPVQVSSEYPFFTPSTGAEEGQR